MSKKLTPMQKQYQKLKADYPDTIVLFRLGDFYEVFNDDALKASKILGLTLTGRGKGENRTPMAGIPHHSLGNYLPKLISAGVKVAIADQTEEAVPGKLVERKITKIITPGTITDENSLESDKNNYIASVYLSSQKGSQIYYFAFCDLTTGDFKTFRTDNVLILRNEIHKINPAEILVSDNQFALFHFLDEIMLTQVSNKAFNIQYQLSKVKEQLQVQSLKGFGFEDSDEELIVAGVLIEYLRENQKGNLYHIKRLYKYSYNNYMQLDSETIRNLELLYSNSGDPKATLFFALNKCKCALGKRKLRSWILNPLLDEMMLSERLDSVEFFFNSLMLNAEIREYLHSLSDFERIAGRIGYNSASPKDVKALATSLEFALGIIQVINTSSEELPTRVKFLLTSFNQEKIEELIQLINAQIKEDPPIVINEAGIFVDGFNEKVDDYRNISRNSKQILADIQKREIEATSIPSLKVSFNKVFGYYIEVTKTHVSKVPDSYIRKQTLTNAERYITQELKDVEEKIMSAQDLLINLERELFQELIQKLTEYLPIILDFADKIAELDVLSNFGHLSRQNEYIKPSLLTPRFESEEAAKISPTLDFGNSNLIIKDGRHPVVEKIADSFIANDSEFNSNSSIHILTGPNMSGKSTYIRQVALINLIAQIGCFVPAKEMKFSITDRIFTRVGASDNLAKGESTFMVEMSETANILNNATEKSLIILDEVGRGTSTYDGVAIAWSIVEFIQEHIKAKTLFATHYHELIALEQKNNGIKNFNVEVETLIDDNGEEHIEFKYKIGSGGTNRSYGVHVAKIAGIPDKVISRADEILKRFEDGDRESNNKRDMIKDGGEKDTTYLIQDSDKNNDERPKIKDNSEKSKVLSPKSNVQNPSRPKKISPEQLGFL